MKIIRVNDWDLSGINAEDVDLLICASGYERRSTHLFTLLSNMKIRKRLVLGLEHTVREDWRAENDDVFRSIGSEISVLGSNEEIEIYEILKECIPRFERVRVVVDYSSMPRKWINSIINYFKFLVGISEVELYFCYTPGRHVDRDSVPVYPVSDYQITSVESLSTLEGAAVRQRRTTAVVGLGFEWIAPFAACELIEPDEVRCFYGEPGSVVGYGKRALELNSRFLSEFCRDDEPLPFAVNSVEAVYRNLGEIVSPALIKNNVALIPLGPKTHVLGCILLANKISDLTCLYVRGHRDVPQQVEPAKGAEIVVTRVHLSNGEVTLDPEEVERFELRRSEETRSLD